MNNKALLCLLVLRPASAFVVPASAPRTPLRLHSAPITADVAAAVPPKPQEELLAPGLREDELFELDESIYYWKDFKSLGNEQNLQHIRSVLQKQDLQDDDLARAYWGSHLLRSGYFTFNAALGSFASDLHERFIGGQRQPEVKSDNLSTNGAMVDKLLDSDIPTRLLLETAKTYEQDYKHIESGLLKYPWDAFIQKDKGVQLSTHRQFNPLFVVSETARAVQESVGIFSRRNKQGTTKLWQPRQQSNLYPEYYLNDFHYQTDGWLSSESANRYEVATETLFLGRQDAQQRQTLLPLLERTRKTGKAPQRILEVACGTGRFGTFVRDNFPDANLTMTDLSPYYLEKARENDDYWRSFQNKDAAIMPSTFVQANAESLPFEDNSFDAVVCVYLFHELPHEARKRAAAEMQRVCNDGGMIVLTDSMQVGDRPLEFQNIRNFAKLNEPHYANYVQDEYLPDLYAGCKCDKKYMVSSTKTTSFLVEK